MKTKFFKIYSILFLLLIIKINNNDKECHSNVIRNTIKISIEDTMTLNKQNLEYIVYNTFKDSVTGKIDSMNAEYTIKQIYLESGHLKSSLCLENNNLTGMKHPRVRQTTSLGQKNGYAYYENWIQCVKDLYLWRKENNLIGASERTLLKILKKKYAEDPNYTRKLATIATLKDDRTEI
jgi:hypothetical protein